MYKKLAAIAAELDAYGLFQEADIVTNVLQKVSKKSHICEECGEVLTKMKSGENICQHCGPHSKNKPDKPWKRDRGTKEWEREYASRKAQNESGVIDMHNKAYDPDHWECEECGALNLIGPDGITNNCEECGAEYPEARDSREEALNDHIFDNYVNDGPYTYE